MVLGRRAVCVFFPSTRLPGRKSSVDYHQSGTTGGGGGEREGEREEETLWGSSTPRRTVAA